MWAFVWFLHLFDVYLAYPSFMVRIYHLHILKRAFREIFIQLLVIYLVVYCEHTNTARLIEQWVDDIFCVFFN